MPSAIRTPNPAALAAEAWRGAGDVVAMLRGITTDSRVPQAAKLEASAALAYLASGRGRIPRFVPVMGRLDDLAIAAFALRRLLTAAGEPVLRSHWRGSERGLERMLTVTAALANPGGRWRQAAVASAAVSFVREQLGGRSPAARRRPGLGRVVEGEVLSRREVRW